MDWKTILNSLDWISAAKDILIPLLTVAVAGATAYAGAKAGRRSLYRQIVYTKQIDAYFELFEPLNEFVGALVSYKHNDERDKAELYKKCGDHLDRMFTTFYKWQFFMPSDVNKAYHDFMLLGTSVIDRPINHIEVINITDSAFQELYVATRRSLGIDALHGETTKLIWNTRIPPTVAHAANPLIYPLRVLPCGTPCGGWGGLTSFPYCFSSTY